MTTLVLEDTDAGAVESAIRSGRRAVGNMIPGMAMTLVIVTDEESQAEAVTAAEHSAGRHPCRILVVINRPGKGDPRLDAQISFAVSDSPAESIILRLIGPLASHSESVVLPLLLPDTPVVAWWPSDAPVVPADDPIGRLADRRITDAARHPRPFEALGSRARSYRPGDTDLSWTRVTGWRSLLASCLDEPCDGISGASVSCPTSCPSGAVLAAWLRARLGIPVALRRSRGPDITKASITTSAGEISISRHDGAAATLRRPEERARIVPLRIRRLRDVVMEEIHRLGPDEVYAQTLANLESPMTADEEE